MDADILLDRHAHAVINRRAVRVKQEILRVYRHNLDRNAAFFHHTNSRLPHLARNRLRSRFKYLLRLDYDLANAGSVDFRHQFNLVNRLSNLVYLEILHHLQFQGFNVQRIAVYILQIVFDVEKVTLAKDCLHNLSVASLNGLLCGRSNNTAAL